MLGCVWLCGGVLGCCLRVVWLLSVAVCLLVKLLGFVDDRYLVLFEGGLGFILIVLVLRYYGCLKSVFCSLLFGVYYDTAVSFGCVCGVGLRCVAIGFVSRLIVLVGVKCGLGLVVLVGFCLLCWFSGGLVLVICFVVGWVVLCVLVSCWFRC